MDIELFQKLLLRSESQTLDFKAKMYDFQEKSAILDMTKDIVTFYNTPREQSAYIIIGVKEDSYGIKDEIGVDQFYDDATLQTVFKSDWVNLKPSFTYHAIEYNGLKFGAIEIPVEKMGLCTFNKSASKISQGVVYYRNGSVNEIASAEKMTFISNWFENRTTRSDEIQEDRTWTIFKDRMNNFKDNKNYILLTDLTIEDFEKHGPEPLNNIQWTTIIDFNAKSETDGLLKVLKPLLEENRVLHTCVEQDSKYYPYPGLSWYFGNGIVGYSKAEPQQTERDWRKKYKKHLENFLQSCNDIFNPNPIVVVVLWNNLDFNILVETIKQFDEIFDDRIEYLCIDFNENLELKKVVNNNDNYTIEALKYPLSSLFKSLRVHFISKNVKKESFCIPESHGGESTIENKDWLWFCEDLEILHTNIGMGEGHLAKEFRQGETISWEGLANHYDCDRTITYDLNKKIAKDLDSKIMSRINLYYSPGSGGSTIARRIAWDLHKRYPVCILTGDPIKSIQKIIKLRKISNKSVLVIIDKDTYTQKSISDLLEYLKADSSSAVILQVVRRFEKESSKEREATRTFWLDECLDDHESNTFLNAYSNELPLMKEELKLIHESDTQCRSAFLYGISAYNTNFKGISGYVKDRLSVLSSDQKKIMLYIAISHYYGHLSIHLQLFAEILGLPKTKVIELDKLFSGEASSNKTLLIQEKNGSYRMLHQSIAFEVMKRLLDEVYDGMNWKQNLSNKAKEFINFCRNTSLVPSKISLDIVTNVFIVRENKELVGDSKRYSQIIQDIPIIQGRIEVLKHLVEEFESEAHFKAHLSRLLREDGNYKDALIYIEDAISLQPEDHVLHHIKGTLYSTMVKNEEDIEKVVTFTKQASICFEETRHINPKEEHGYNSEIQVIIMMIDKIRKAYNSTALEILINSDDEYVKKSLEKAEYLLETVQYLHGGERPTEFTLSLKAQISNLYGDHSKALQQWDNLLNKSIGDKNYIRRQIARTYLDKHNRNWNNLQQKEVERIINLMESNISEDTKDINSLKIWLHAIRQSSSNISIDFIIERITYWKTNTNSLEAAFYLYVFHALNAILNHNSQSAVYLTPALEECKILSRLRRDRRTHLEILGNEEGIKALIHRSSLERIDNEVIDWDKLAQFKKCHGRISSIYTSERGEITLEGNDIKVFFNPNKFGFEINRDEKSTVTLGVSFTYDGPIAHQVKAG